MGSSRDKVTTHPPHTSPGGQMRIVLTRENKSAPWWVSLLPVSLAKFLKHDALASSSQTPAILRPTWHMVGGGAPLKKSSDDIVPRRGKTEELAELASTRPSSTSLVPVRWGQVGLLLPDHFPLPEVSPASLILQGFGAHAAFPLSQLTLWGALAISFSRT